jgi:transposase InsO family protein
MFTTAPNSQILADHWHWEYNALKPHSALQGLTPWGQPNRELQHDHNYPLS